MIMILQLIGWTLIAAASALFGYSSMTFLLEGHFPLISLGQAWFDLDAEGLNSLRMAVRSYLPPLLWERIVDILLMPPAIVILGLLGMLLLALSWIRNGLVQRNACALRVLER